jgi:hypothetical protein
VRIGATPTRVNEPTKSIPASEPPLVAGNDDVARARGERLRLAKVLALEDHRQVVPVHAEVPDLLDGLVELGPVVYHPHYCVLGDPIRCLPAFQYVTSKEGSCLPRPRWVYLSTAYIVPPLHTSPSPSLQGNLFHKKCLVRAIEDDRAI